MSDKQDSYWLIERIIPYWETSWAQIDSEGRLFWTIDAQGGLRFCRKEDAIAFMCIFQKGKDMFYCMPTEHVNIKGV